MTTESPPCVAFGHNNAVRLESEPAPGRGLTHRASNSGPHGTSEPQGKARVELDLPLADRLEAGTDVTRRLASFNWTIPG